MDQDFNYLRFYKIITAKWYYLLVATLLSILAAFLFLKMANPDYRSNASIKVDDKKSELSELISIKNIYDRSSKSESEKFILYSRNVLTKAISSLNYPIEFYLPREYFGISSIYPQQPIIIQTHKIPNGKWRNTLFLFEKINEREYKLSYTLNKSKVSKRYAYGEELHFNGFAFRVSAISGPYKSYYFKFSNLNTTFAQVKQSLVIDDNQNTNILSLSYTDANPYFARDILNAILKEYQLYDKTQRSLAIKQTSFYIDTLLKNMAVVLQQSGEGMQQFKTANQMLNISSNGEKLLQLLTNLEAEQQRIDIQSLLTRELQRDLRSNEGTNNPNFNLQGVDDPLLISLIQKYNLLTDQRNKDLTGFPAQSEVILQLDEALLSVKNAMNNNINSQHVKNKKLQDYLVTQSNSIRKSIQTIPVLERTYINLQSDYNINQKVYDYLSEKKLEAHISTASVTSGAQIIDQAVLGAKPVYPVALNTYKDFTIAGLFIGILSIFIIRKINPYLYDVESIEESSSIPIIGSIRNQVGKPDNNNILSIDSPASLFSESIRAMRANLDYLVAGKHGQVVCITSEIAGEGKSFTSLNLAGTLCLIDKRVLIIATDLRKSQLHKTFQMPNDMGLSSYLTGIITMDNLCMKTKYKNLDFIPAGPVPDHPAELLHSDQMRYLLDSLKKNYDYIILDSAPVGLVSDSIPLMRMADINLFVLRYGVSRSRAAKLPERLAQDFNLRHMAIVLNAFKENHNPKGYYSLSPDKQVYNRYYKLIDQ
ncbi:capsular exopolysaccharide synthesis family protein [Pedobacter sp. CAN_A7]|uniref:polysaccharide biosynthesis tyrosine autokinase n=1 Tax=Pedobacter sp. CAN_A7 TaxID=2787722 RepID=UPI0018CA3988